MANKQRNINIKTTSKDELLDAAMKLVGKLKIIHGSKAYKKVWEIAQSHQGPYDGLSCADEIEALQRAINKSVLN